MGQSRTARSRRASVRSRPGRLPSPRRWWRRRPPSGPGRARGSNPRCRTRARGAGGRPAGPRPRRGSRWSRTSSRDPLRTRTSGRWGPSGRSPAGPCGTGRPPTVAPSQARSTAASVRASLVVGHGSSVRPWPDPDNPHEHGMGAAEAEVEGAGHRSDTVRAPIRRTEESTMTTHTGSITHDGLGEILRPGDPGYDEARHVWNGTIDRFPALIARCRTTEEVAAAVRMADVAGLEIAVRAGGHSIPGLSVCEGGVMIDLSPMKGIEVDADRRIARAQPGLLWGEYDAGTQAHGLASPGGEISHTGVAGLTLGGGIGWLSRRHGLACDNLVGAQVVLADGSITEVDEDRDPDLLWGLRGGGGNFGIVTEFRFRVHPVPRCTAACSSGRRRRRHEVLGRYTDAWRRRASGPLPRGRAARRATGAVRARRVCSSSPWSRSPRCGPATPPIRSAGGDRTAPRAAAGGRRLRRPALHGDPAVVRRRRPPRPSLPRPLGVARRAGRRRGRRARRDRGRGVVAVQPGARPPPRRGDRRRRRPTRRRSATATPRTCSRSRRGGRRRRRAPRRVDPTLVGAAAPLVLRGRLREPPRGRRGARPGARRLRSGDLGPSRGPEAPRTIRATSSTSTRTSTRRDGPLDEEQVRERRPPAPPRSDR